MYYMYPAHTLNSSPGITPEIQHDFCIISPNYTVYVGNSYNFRIPHNLTYFVVYLYTYEIISMV